MKNRKLSVHVEHELLLKLESAGLNDDLAQKVIESKGNKIAKQMVGIILPEPIVDERFEFVKEFKLTVPTDYDHATQLATFSEKYKKGFYSYNENITDNNFAKATNKLVPGKTYTVKIFGIKQTIQSQDGLGLIASQKGILAGAQGASLVYQLAKDELPKGKWYISFDEKDALWVDSDGGHRVPGVDHDSGGDFGFDLGSLGGGWTPVICVLCFCDSE